MAFTYSHGRVLRQGMARSDFYQDPSRRQAGIRRDAKVQGQGGRRGAS